MNAQIINSKLNNLIAELKNDFPRIDDERLLVLKHLAEVIQTQLAENGSANLIFVCTHNSRRSQLAEIWMRTAVQYYNKDSIYSFSGGTESTAFNHRMVDAVKKFGFELGLVQDGKNPVYQLSFSEDSIGPTMFSKKYDDAHNPQSDFIAVMVCSDADKNCPLVTGPDARISLPYLDPKKYDNTETESEAYDGKVAEIGIEILYLVSLL